MGDSSSTNDPNQTLNALQRAFFAALSLQNQNITEQNASANTTSSPKIPSTVSFNHEQQGLGMLKKQLAEALQQVDEQKMENDNLKTMVEILNSDNTNLHAKIVELKKEVANLKKTNEELAQAISEQAMAEQNTEETDKLKKELETIKMANEQLTRVIAEQSTLITESLSERKAAEQEAKNLKSQNDSHLNSLEVHRVRIEELEKELETVNLEKVKSESEKLEQIETLTSEKNELVRKCNTIKQSMSELKEENASLTQLTEQILNQNEEDEESESDVQLDDELEDTSCTICTEEMKLKKCTPCRRRFHASCIDKWLTDNQTCPTCRASWIN